jgi:hypothetical protein
MLMFIDEMAKNDRTTGRPKGWSLRGRRCIQRRAFIHGKRYSILPVLTLDGIVAHNIVEGSVNTEHLIKFLKEHVVSVGLSIPIVLQILHRSLSQILIPDHEVFSSSTTAASIMPKKSGPLSRIEHVSNKLCIR